MDFGVVLQTNPPAWRTVQLAELAEAHGFDYVWTFDSHLLWQEPYVIYSQILSRTKRVIVGPMVTNPATRDWTVTASVFATLNEMFGNRTVCGIGRGDSAVRVTNGKPTTLKEVREATHVIRELANCRPVDYKGSHAAVPVGADVGAGGVGRRVRTAGPQDGRRGRRRLHPAAGRRGHRRVDDHQRPGGGRGRRPRSRRRSRSASPPRTTSATTGRTCATSAAGSAAWSATTWPTSWRSTASTSRRSRRR